MIKVSGQQTLQKTQHTLEIAEDLIENLTDRGIRELFGGTESDFNAVIDSVIEEAYHVLYGEGESEIKESSTEYLDAVHETFNETLLVNDCAYFATHLLENVQVSNHHIEWADLVRNARRFAVLASRDSGKCISEDEYVVLHNGKHLKAKELKVGDKLMSPSGKANTITRLNRDYGQLYRIKQKKGQDYLVTENHILSLVKRKSNGDRELVDISVKDYLNLSDTAKRAHYYGYRVPVKYKSKKVKIDPYLLGVWLGDGEIRRLNFSNPDSEIIDYCRKYAKDNGLLFKIKKDGDANCYRFSITDEKKGGYTNHLRKEFVNYGLMKSGNDVGEKFIPEDYLKNSEKVRLELLAGIIDTDGDYMKVGNSYRFSQKSYEFCLQVKQLCDSLGFYTSITEEHNNSFGGNFLTHRVFISGQITKIPCKVVRKQAGELNKFDYSKYDFEYDVSLVNSLDVQKDKAGWFVSFSLDGDKRHVLPDGTVTHNSFWFSVVNILWKAYCYNPQSRNVRRRFKKGFMFAHTAPKAEDYLATVKEFIETTPILKEKLYNSSSWNKTEITCQTGFDLKARGFFSSVRGYHPHFIQVDDPLTDNIIYSKVQREKAITYFYSVIMNMIVPKGQVGVVGTPFTSDDLYSTFRDREKLKIWKYREYPAIFPDGTLLWDDRYDLDLLLEKRKDNGHLIFSREFMLKPIVSDVSIFPMEILQNSIGGSMSKYTLVSSIDAFPKKFKWVITGCDFSISADAASDSTVFLTYGITDTNEMWLINVWASKTARYNEQVERLKHINRNFRPDIVVAEANNFQRIYVESFPDDDIPIVPHTTGTNKNDLRDGLPSMAIFYERGKIKYPRGNESSRKVSDIILNEHQNVAFTDKGLQAVDGHDDYCMAQWQAKVGLDIMRKLETG